MSNLGAIGNLMRESSIEDLLELSYAENVGKILSGKNISRAVRVHLHFNLSFLCNVAIEIEFAKLQNEN